MNYELLLDFDTQLLLWINGMHTSFLDQFMWLVSGKAVWIPFYLVSLYVVYKNVGWKQTLQMLLMIGIMMLFTDMINSQVIRPLFHRLRPANLDSPIGNIVHIVNDYRGGAYGFPSAHAANYCGLTLIVAYFMRSKIVLLSMFAMTAIVCYSRSYLGVHYPGDLFAGIIYATLVVTILIYIHNHYLPLEKQTSAKLEWLPGIAALLSFAIFGIIAFFS